MKAPRPIDPQRRAKLLADVERQRAERGAGYREQALKLFPHVCARCGREFEGKRLRELTVHHKDHDHHNNPPDGSNWELLCLYCHDNEHQDATQRATTNRAPLAINKESALGFNAFEGLRGLLGSAPDEPASSDREPE